MKKILLLAGDFVKIAVMVPFQMLQMVGAMKCTPSAPAKARRHGEDRHP